MVSLKNVTKGKLKHLQENSWVGKNEKEEESHQDDESTSRDQDPSQKIKMEGQVRWFHARKGIKRIVQEIGHEEDKEFGAWKNS